MESRLSGGDCLNLADDWPRSNPECDRTYRRDCDHGEQLRPNGVFNPIRSKTAAEREHTTQRNH
jgi:hypothetical protein